MRVARAGGLAAAIALLATLATPAIPGVAGGRVLAHAQLVASSPGAGSIVATSPDEIRLIFSEPLESQASSIDINDLNGLPVVTRVGTIDPADPYALVVADPQLDDGVYLLTWRSLSAADGHTAEGFFNFGVGDVPGSLAGGPRGSTHTDAAPTSVIGRWLTYVGLLLALGMAVFHRVVIRAGPMPARLARLLGLALLVSASATLVAAGVSGVEAGAIGDYLLGSRNGSLQLARGVVSSVGGIALLLIAPRFAAPVAGATGLIGVVLLVAAGHASGLPGPVPIIGQVVHVAGAAVWIGGIVGLLALVTRPRLLTDGPPPKTRTLVPRFSALALTSIGLVALTGVYAAYTQTGVLVSFDTDYSRTLLLKSGFALGALAMGGLNFLDGGRMMRWLDGFRSRIVVEVLAAGAVLAFAGVLALTPPTEEPMGVSIEPVPDAFGVIAPDTGMRVVPGRTGVNRIVVTTTDALAGSTSLDLVLDRLDTGGSTRVRLVPPGMTGMDNHGDAGDMSGMDHGGAEGTIDWVADAIALPPGSRWDTSAVILTEADGNEVSRQRFAFALGADGIDEGRAASVVNPANAAAMALLLAGAVAAGLGLGGAALPRCEPAASRVALLVGGSAAVLFGGMAAVTRFLG